MTDPLWSPVFVCPVCRTTLSVMGASYWCPPCRATYVRRDGITRLLAPERLCNAERWHRQYDAVRRVDGHGSRTPAEYRALPRVRADDPCSAEWRIRQESFQTLILQIDLGRSAVARRVLDLGAGNLWLSNRVATLGHQPVAVDIRDDDADGLQVWRVYDTRLVPVQADFDALPFADAQFDVAILNASLHYSPDPARTLEEANRVLAPGGALVVMDSPMFDGSSDGEAMVASQFETLRTERAVDAPVRPGIGFLTFGGLAQTAAQLGRRASFTESNGPAAWQARRWWGSRRLGRAPATFGVWVAQ